MKTNFNNAFKKYQNLKKLSGSHSPSIKTVISEIPEIKIKIDACFLSNPYATDLFLKFFNSDFPNPNDLRDLLEFYPPQNNSVAKYIEDAIQINRKNIFIGNGAIEIISAVIKRFCGNNILLPRPTFSSYYEYVRTDQKITFFNLKEENDYEINSEDLINKIKTDNSIDSLILINPNNPNGSYLSLKEISKILDSSKHLECIILDESFVHFAYENNNLELMNFYKLFNKYPNLVIIKSMSKDFGIAGVRAGYSIMSEKRVSSLLKNDYLWNISGLAAYFFSLYRRTDFRQQYEIVRKKYIMNTLLFHDELKKLKNVKVFPSKANFFLIKINEKFSGKFGFKMLYDHGIYVRDCSDKIGLNGNGYYRVASRSFEENYEIINGFTKEIIQ